MKRNTLNAVVDAIMFACIIVIIFTGVVMWLFIGKGRVPAEQKYLWGLHRHDWGNIHLVFSVSLVVLAAFHFILHWGWIVGRSRKLTKLPAPAIIAILLAISAILFLIAFAYRHGHPGPYGEQRLRRAGRELHDPRQSDY